MGEAGPRQCPIFEQKLGYQVVDRNRYSLHNDYCYPQTDGSCDFFRDRQKGAHAEEKGERQVFDENRFDEQADIGLHQITSVLCTW